MTSNVIALFPGRAPPGSREPDPGFIDRFIERTLCNTLWLLANMEDTSDEQEFRDRMAVVQQDVAAWPTE